MGIKFLLLFPLVAVLFISGCTQTGSIINKSAQDDEPGFIAAPTNDVNHTSEEDMNEDETEIVEYSYVEDVDDTEEKPVDPCEDITCSDSVTICDDGFKARCKNSCYEGICTICRPDCAGHEVEEPEVCELSCGVCEDENLGSCRCDLIVPCDGNGACEEGEYPDSSDCPDCNDDNSCSDDLYNYSNEQCYHEIAVPCCGNGACEADGDNPENHTSCPEDCNASQDTYIPKTNGTVSISSIDKYDEWVEITNSQSMDENFANWTLADSADHVFTFPDFILTATSSVYVHTGQGTDNATDLFWGRGSPVWNNDGDNATLRNEDGDIVTSYSY